MTTQRLPTPAHIKAQNSSVSHTHASAVPSRSLLLGNKITLRELLFQKIHGKTPPPPQWHINKNLPAVTRETQRQPRTSRKNLSIFGTLGRHAVPFTLAGGAVLTGGLVRRVVLLGIHVSSCVSSRLQRRNNDGLSAAFRHLGQRSRRPPSPCARSTASTVPDLVSRRAATSQRALSSTGARVGSCFLCVVGPPNCAPQPSPDPRLRCCLG